jgi:hypothetical protein
MVVRSRFAWRGHRLPQKTPDRSTASRPEVARWTVPDAHTFLPRQVNKSQEALVRKWLHAAVSHRETARRLGVEKGTASLAALCQEIDAVPTTFPGTNFRLRFAVEPHQPITKRDRHVRRSELLRRERPHIQPLDTDKGFARFRISSGTYHFQAPLCR